MATRYVPKGTTDLGTVTINDSDMIVIGEGSQTISAGTDLSGLSTGLIGVVVRKECSGWVGTSSSPLRCDIDAGSPNEFYFAGSGGAYVYPGGGSSLITKITHAGTGQLHLVVGGTVTNLEQSQGFLYVPDVVTVTNIAMTGGSMTQLYSGTANTNWRIMGGTLATGRGFSGAAYIGSAANVVVRRVDSSATLPTGATWYIAGGRSRGHAVEWHGQNMGTVHLLSDDASIDMSNVFVDATVTVHGSAAAIRKSRLESKYKHVSITATVNSYVGDPDSIGESQA